MSDKTITSGKSHESGTTTPHLNNTADLKNRPNKSLKQKHKSAPHKIDASAKIKHPRKGKSLLSEESADESKSSDSGDKKSSGIRTISVREWLRRG